MRLEAPINQTRTQCPLPAATAITSTNASSSHHSTPFYESYYDTLSVLSSERFRARVAAIVRMDTILERRLRRPRPPGELLGPEMLAVRSLLPPYLRGRGDAHASYVQATA